jgi:hypothetical protein
LPVDVRAGRLETKEKKTRELPPAAEYCGGVSSSGSTLYVPNPSLFGEALPLEAVGERSERTASSGRRDRASGLGTPAVPWLSWIRRPFMESARTVTWDELRIGPAFARMGSP